jgi:hypothetical protein
MSVPGGPVESVGCVHEGNARYAPVWIFQGSVSDSRCAGKLGPTSGITIHLCIQAYPASLMEEGPLPTLSNC